LFGGFLKTGEGTMTPIELMAELIKGNFGMLEMTLGDFSDADMMVRPVPGANHALWQLGHLAKEDAFFGGLIPGVKVPALPAWAEKFGKGSNTNDDPKGLPTKAELLKVMAGTKEAVVEGVRKLKPEDLNQPSPENIRSFAPTIGHVVGLIGSHWMMHMGQFQVIRRKLGKPVLF
jgi:hypothetical protein